MGPVGDFNDFTAILGGGGFHFPTPKLTTKNWEIPNLCWWISGLVEEEKCPSQTGDVQALYVMYTSVL